MEQKSLLDKTKELCRKLEIVPTRSKGQNFLVSREVLDKIVAVANLGPEDLVLEIGPGLGILTEELVRRTRRVVAVELDKKLFSYLSEKFKSVNNLDLVEGDIIKLLNYQIVKLLGNKNYKVVANLPYQITAHILRLLLESAPTTPARELATSPQRGGSTPTTPASPSRDSATPPRAGGEITEMVLMVQKEVGERICAKRGDMSVLAVMVQYYGQPEMVGIVGKENFWPVPEVDSAIIKIKRQKLPARNASRLAMADGKGKIKEELFFKLVKVGFSGKRKMLKNNLRNIYDEKKVLAVLAELGLDAKARAEDLGAGEWIKLYQKLGDGGKG